MNYFLVSPTWYGVGENTGSQFITDGIRYILRAVDPDARFFHVPMLTHDEEAWAAAYHLADVIVLCGNPRTNGTEEKTYWDWTLWRYILKAVDAGIRVVDGWAGAAFGLNGDGGFNVVETRKNAEVMKHESRLSLVVVRDRIAFDMMRGAGVKAYLLPCSSWFAASWHGIRPAEKTRNAVVVRRLPGYADLVPKLVHLADELAADKPCSVVATNWPDYKWLTEGGCRSAELITEPESLLRFYSTVDKLVSLRIHASIPAASLGASVANLHNDSRSLTLQPFGLPSRPFTDLLQGRELVFGTGKAPDFGQYVEAFRGLITPLTNAETDQAG